MMLNSCLRCGLKPFTTALSSVRKISSASTTRSKFDPDYLKIFDREFPCYDLLNVQLRGYDFAVLEQCQSFLHRLAKNMGIEVEDAWATPAQTSTVNVFKSGSTKVEHQYDLALYERNVQVSNLKAHLAGVFFEMVHSSLPEGVQLSIHEHKQEYEDTRYIPDLELEALVERLEEIKAPRKK